MNHRCVVMEHAKGEALDALLAKRGRRKQIHPAAPLIAFEVSDWLPVGGGLAPPALAQAHFEEPQQPGIPAAG